MTREEKVQLLPRLFVKLSNHGVLTWGETENGYRWTCEDHAIAKWLATNLMNAIQQQGMDATTFPYRFQPEGGATLIIEPVGD